MSDGGRPVPVEAVKMRIGEVRAATLRGWDAAGQAMDLLDVDHHPELLSAHAELGAVQAVLDKARWLTAAAEMAVDRHGAG